MNYEKDILGEFTYTGKWRSPKNPFEKIYGILKFKREYIRLELSGVFSKKHAFQTLELETMHGLTNENEEITLYQVSELYFKGSHLSESKNNFGESIFSCEYIFVGRHYDHTEDLIFNSLGIGFTYLEKWINNKLTYKRDDDSYNIKTKSIKYELDLDSINSTLHISSIPMNLGDFQTEIRILYTSSMIIKPHKSKEWKWFQESINNLKNLLTLLIGYPVYPTYLSADPIDRHNFESIKIYYCVPNPLIFEDLHPREIDISLPDMIKYANRDTKRIANVMNNWFKKKELIGPVYDLFFLTFYDNSMSNRTRFLTLMQAIETFHRRIYEGKYLDDEKYEPIYEILVSAIPEEIDENFKKSLIGKLRYGNEFSLMSRLKLLDNYGKRMNWFDMIMKGEDDILRKLVDTRNYYTHFDERSKRNMIKDADLPRVNYKLKIFLRILLLEELDSKGIVGTFRVFESFQRKMELDKIES